MAKTTNKWRRRRPRDQEFPLHPANLIEKLMKWLVAFIERSAYQAAPKVGRLFERGWERIKRIFSRGRGE